MAETADFIRGKIAALEELSIDVIDSGSWKNSVRHMTAAYRAELAKLPPAPTGDYCQMCGNALDGYVAPEATDPLYRCNRLTCQLAGMHVGECTPADAAARRAEDKTTKAREERG